MDQDLVHPDILTIYGTRLVDGVLGDIFSGGFSYLRFWRNDQQILLQASYLMGLI